jgi:hypothetical protein
LLHLPALFVVVPVPVLVVVPVMPLLGPLFAPMVALGVETTYRGSEQGQTGNEEEHSALHDGLLNWMDRWVLVPVPLHSPRGEEVGFIQNRKGKECRFCSNI